MANKFKLFEELHNAPTGINSSRGAGAQQTKRTSEVATADGDGYKKRKKMAEFEAMHNHYTRQFSVTNRNDGSDDFVRSFLVDSQNYIRESAGILGRINWKEAVGSDKQDTRTKAAENMRRRASDVRAFLMENQADIDDDKYKLLMDYLDDFDSDFKSISRSLDEMKQHYSKWNTEEDYNRDVEAALEYHKLLNTDLEAEQKEIDYLERLLDEYDILSRTMTDERGTARLEEIQQQYGTTKDLKRAITERRQNLTFAQRAQEGSKLSSPPGNDDFNKYSVYTSTKNDGAWSKLTSRFGMGYDDLTYEYINGGQNGMRDEILRKGASFAGEQFDYDEFMIYDNMDDDEIAVYNYHYAKDGKDAAEKYLDSIRYSLNEREATATFEKMEDKPALELLFGIESGADQFQQSSKDLVKMVTGDDSYRPPSADQMLSGMVGEDLREKGGAWGVAYDLLNTTTNMAPSILTSVALSILNPKVGQVVGNLMMGGTAAGSAYQEAINNGYTKEQARLYGTLIGVSETALNKLLGSIGAFGGKVSTKSLTAMLDGVSSGFLRVAGKLGLDMGSEGIEEGLQDVLETLFSNWILHTDEKINWGEAGYSALLGSLSALALEGGTTIYNDAQTTKQGKELLAAGISPERLRKLGSTFSADSVAYQLAGKVNENTGAYTMAKLFEEAGAELTEANKADIQRSLEQKGMSSHDAEVLANGFADAVVGGLSETQQRILEVNDVLAQTVKEVIIDPNSTANQRSLGYKEMLRQLADQTAAENAARQASSGQAVHDKLMALAQEKAAADMVSGKKKTPSGTETVEGKDVHKNTQAAVSTDNIKTITKDGVMFAQEDGTEVSSKDVDYADAEDAVLFEAFTEMRELSTEQANEIVKIRRETGGSGHFFTNVMRMAYEYGYANQSDAMLLAKTYRGGIPNETVLRFYNIGKEARRTEDSRRAQAPRSAPGGKTAVYRLTETGEVKQLGEGKGAIKELAVNERRSIGVKTAQFLQKIGLGGNYYFIKSYINKDGKRVFVDRDGKVKEAHNGMYYSNGDIYIDLNAGTDSSGITLFTLSHELTHFIQQWNPEKYRALADFLAKHYAKQGVSAYRAVKMKQQELADARGTYVPFEEAYHEFVADSLSTMFSDGDLYEKLLDLKKTDKTLSDKIHSFVKKLAKAARAFYSGEIAPTLEGQFMQLQSKETIDRLEQLFAEALVGASENYAADGAYVKNATEEVQFSTKHDGVYMDKAVSANTKGYVSDAVMEKARKDRSFVAGVLTRLTKEKKLGIPDDIEGNTYIANSSYDGTEENTTICPRSLASEAFMDAVSENLGRPLTVAEQIHISQELQGMIATPECLYCYVATDRKAYRAFLGSYIEQRDAVIDAYKKGNTDVSRGGSLYEEFLAGRKDTPNMWKRFNLWIDAYKSGKPMLEASHLASISKLMGDINEYGSGIKAQIKDAMAYAQSASWAKKRIGYVAYNNHILRWNKGRIEKLNSHYGLRMYSFSDFSPAFILENMQMITDAAVRGLKMLGYTKEIDFVRIFAKTGMNINVSTFGFEVGGNVYENNIIGADWEKAKKLRSEYPNVGITFVATNDTLVNWALGQDWIDVVIPYHLVRTGKEVAAKLDYTNYTAESSDVKDIGWTKGVDQKYIAPTEHNNDYDTYMAVLKANHLKPRFERFIDHPNYMKLVNETRQSASESKPVQPVFDMDAAKESLAKLETDGYYQPIGGTVDRMYEIAAGMAEDLDGVEVQYSTSIPVNDVTTDSNGILLVNINSKTSGLNAYPKQKWPSVISSMIRKTLAGKSIIAVDGDIITVTRRGAKEVAYGPDTQTLRAEGWKNNDYSQFNQKMITAEHAATIIALSKYSSWGHNTKDPLDAFKKDGLNYRTIEMLIDGIPHTATVVTGLNGDASDTENYGEKFYDIESIEKQTSHPAVNGAPNNGTSPHLIKTVDSSSDRLTLTQKQRIVNNENMAYSAGDSATKSPFAEAYLKALHQKSDTSSEPVSNRTLLANAFEGLAQHEVEQKHLREYKETIEKLNAEEQKLRELNAQIRELSFAKGPRDKEKLRILKDKAQRTANHISVWDGKLLRMEASTPLQNVLDQAKKNAYQRGKAKGEARLDKKRREQLETADKRIAKAKLQKLVLDTSKWISYPAKTDVKCPDILKQPYADFLNSIDMSSERLSKGGDPTKNDLRLTNAMNSLGNALEKIMAAQDPASNESTDLDAGYLDLPADFVKNLRETTEKITDMMVEGEYVVNNMTAEEVRKLSQTIRTLNHAIKTMSKLYANMRFSNIEALGIDTMKFMDALGEIQKTGKTADFIQWENALPYYAFKRFGKGGESVFEELMDAQDKLAYLADTIFAFQKKTWTEKEAKTWSEDVHTIKLPNGSELTLTTADAMGIYCLSRRPQGIQHLLGGGVRIIGIQKGSQKVKDSRSTLTVKEIDLIISSLTDRQKRVAEAIQEFMSTTCAEWGNEISMKRFLTKEFTEKYYYPIESNDENMPTKDPTAQQSDLFRLLNISATKALDPRANNEVIVRNIFDVFSGHASDMARLNAYGMALLDYMKWLNYRQKSVNEIGQVNTKGVRKSMEMAFGDAARSYVVNLIKDVNGRPSDGGLPGFYTRMVRNTKTAMVGGNARVAALQFTSYPRAALVLSPRNLALGLSKAPKIKQAKKYCGIALWKSFGFYDTNISRGIEEQMKGVKSAKQKLIELSLKGAEWGDEITWGFLWNACEYEVAATKKYEIFSEEFNKAVGKKLREVVYRTQVVDSALTRSQMMRSKNAKAQELSSFMSESTISANILMDAAMEFNLEKRKTNSKAAWDKTGKYVMRSISVYSIGQLVAAVVEGLLDAWRDDEDEKFGKKFINAFKQNLILDLLPFNKIPIVSEMAEAAMSLLDVGYFSSESLSSTALSQTVSAAKAWESVFGKESSAATYNALYKSVKALSSFFGVSASGVMREGVALWNNTAGAYDPTLKILTYDRSETELGNLLLDAIIEENDRLIRSFTDEFESDDKRQKALRSAVKTRFNEGKIDSESALRYLTEHGGMEKDAAFWKIEEWEYENSTKDDFAKHADFFAAVETGEDLKLVIKKYTDNGVAAKTLKSQITKHFKPVYTQMTGKEKSALKGRLLNAFELCGYDRKEAAELIADWK